MNNTNQSSEVKTKNITLGSIIAWVLGVGSALAGVSMIGSKPLAGVLYLLVAIVLIPPISRGIQSKLNISLSRSVKVLIVLVLFFIIGTTMAGPSSPKIETANNTSNASNQATPVEEAIKVSAVSLSQQYDDNKVAADAKYEGKLVEVSGVIDNIGKDITDTPYVSLKGRTNSLFGVQCMFPRADETQLADLSKGKSITLQGRVSGELIGNVVVRECKIIN